MPEDATPTVEPSVDEVREWRIRVAGQLGYGFMDAVQIAEDGTDLHALADLLEHGCPTELAQRISTPI